MDPNIAEEATVYGEARKTCESLEPIRAGKLRLVVEMQTSSAFKRPKVSEGPPRHAAQDGGPISQPALTKISCSDVPLIFFSFNACATSVVAGTIKVFTDTSLPSKMVAAAMKSVILPPVQDPI